MKNILLFGDSLFWGFIPGSYDYKTCLAKRYQKEKRLSELLQHLLAKSAFIIEDALNGRTTNLDEQIPGRPYRNGLTHLPMSLEMNYPLDLVVLMLGTNDLKVQYGRTPTEISESIRCLIKTIKSSNKGVNNAAPKILLISPPILAYVKNMQDQYNEESVNKSRMLADTYLDVAEQEECEFLDASMVMKVSEIDGVHLDEQQTLLLSQAIYNKISDMYEEK